MFVRFCLSSKLYRLRALTHCSRTESFFKDQKCFSMARTLQKRCLSSAGTWYNVNVVQRDKKMQRTLGSSCLEFINNLSKLMSNAFIVLLTTTIILLTSGTAMGFTFRHQCIQLCPCLSITFTPIMQCESSVLFRFFAFFILCSCCIVAFASKAKNQNAISYKRIRAV